MTIDIERKEFENWASSEGYGLQIGRFGGYLLCSTNSAWKAWQAARAHGEEVKRKTGEQQ